MDNITLNFLFWISAIVAGVWFYKIILYPFSFWINKTIDKLVDIIIRKVKHENRQK